MFIKTHETSVVDVYPLIDELNRETAFSPRIEVFPPPYRDVTHLDGKAVRYNGVVWTREEWAEYLSLIVPAMEEAFRLADEM